MKSYQIIWLIKQLHTALEQLPGADKAVKM